MTKFKKPILILILICFFTVSNTVLPYKKTEAFVVTGTALTYLVLTALAVATGGVIAYNNSQGNGIADIISSYQNGGSTALDDDDFADWLANTYAPNIPELNQYIQGGGSDPQEPQRKPNAVEQAMITSMLTKQGYQFGSDLYQNLYDYYAAHGSESHLPEDPVTLINSFSGVSYGNSVVYAPTLTPYMNQYSQYPYYYQVWKPEYLGKYIKMNFLSGGLANKYVYIHMKGELSGKAVFDIISEDNSIISDLIYKNYQGFNALGQYFNGGLNADTLMGTITFGEPYIPPDELPQFIEPNPVLSEVPEYIPNFYNIDMSAFNGLGYNQQQIMDILNGNMTVSQSEMDKITKAAQDTYLNYLENPVSTPGSPIDPEIDPTTGQPVYGDNFVVDPNIEPNIPPDELTGQGTIIGWLKTLWNTIKFLPTNISNLIKTAFKPVIDFAQRFWQQMEIWAHDNLYVHWVTLQNLLIDNFGQFIGFLQGIPEFLLSAPGLIGTWWTTQGLPDLQALFDPLVNPGATVPPDVIAPPTWSDFYTPIKTTIDFKFPWLFPQLDSISGFYEEPFEDIYANIKIGSVQGTYKIIDMSFINDNKEQVKDTIRAFLMILIWLYNVSMAYKLLRGSELLKSSITGVSGK